MGKKDDKVLEYEFSSLFYSTLLYPYSNSALPLLFLCSTPSTLPLLLYLSNLLYSAPEVCITVGLMEITGYNNITLSHKRWLGSQFVDVPTHTYYSHGADRKCVLSQPQPHTHTH